MLEELNDNLHNADGTKQTQEQVIHSINQENAELSENISSQNNFPIQNKEYKNMEMQSLVEEMQSLIHSHPITEIKDQIENIRKTFSTKYSEMINEKRKIFLEENPDTTNDDFYYDFPLKNKFDQVYNNYKEKRNQYHQSIQEQLKKNLKEKQNIIAELKELIDTATDYQAALKPFNQLRERWNKCGSIPKDHYNIVWNDYHFHVERFYDQLHLDREIRDRDFQNNLEQKQKLISRAKALLTKEDIQISFKELQLLHRIWKEEIGPVAKEHREPIWKEFSDITKQLHDKREQYYANLKANEQENYLKKYALVEELKAINKDNHNNTHNTWQTKIKKIDHIRNQFSEIGKVPADKHESIWNELSEELRIFNKAKNSYYKDIKKEQQENLKIRLEMIEKAKELKDSDDFEAVIPVIKQLQEDWKKIGHIPKKQADELWEQFRNACNHIFDRFHEFKKNHTSVEMENFNKKKMYLSQLKSFTLVGDHQKDLESIKNHIENWKAIGPVPPFRRHIEGKFNKVLDALFDKLSLSKRDSELAKFQNKLNSYIDNQENKKIQQELNFIHKKIDEVQSDILLLQNNVQFIQNANTDNPLIKEINKNIERHKDELNLWKEKQNIIKNSLQQ